MATESEICTKVRKIIDEIGINDSLLTAGTDDSEMNEIIKQHIQPAMRFIYLNADWSLLVPDQVSTISATSSGTTPAYYSGNTNLAEYLRLCYVKGANWNSYVTQPILWTDDDFATLYDYYAMGNNIHPKAGISPVAESGLTKPKMNLIVTSSEDPGSIQVGWMKVPAASSSSYSIQDDIEPAVMYYIAGLTLMSYKDEHADALFQQAMLMAGISTKQN